MIGQTIGSYHITARLGAGGKGEVFRATDTRLGREVAIKFLGDAVHRALRARGARCRCAQSSRYLHPHDVAPNYLVIELVEGNTLAERIVEGPMSLEEALGVARQIAAALDEAHEKGITHRDP